ncbi:MAG: protein translocase subunit SecD [bacterium]
MDKNAIWKWIILIGLVAWSIVTVTPFDKKIKLGIDLAGGSRFVLELDSSELPPDVARDAKERALEVIRNRVDQLGVAEAAIYTEAGDRIVVEAPGMQPEQREGWLKTLQRAAFLEFRMVHAKSEEFVDQLMEKGMAPAGYRLVEATELGRSRKYFKRDATKDSAGVTEGQVRERARSFEPKAGYELLLEEVVISDQELYRPFYVSKRRELTGESLSNAGYEYDQVGRPYVTLKFDSKGAKRFGNLTKDYAPGGAQNPSMNQQRQLAIVLDGTLYSAPAIREPIFGGSAQITGNFSLPEAQQLAVVLRAGALPAPLKLIEDRTIDPTLGADSVASGKKATIYGSLAVFVFMLLYYRLAGVVACTSLIMNIMLLPLGLIVVAGLFSMIAPQGGGGGAISLPTLTLPGIAGIALTIGMAVDANVLIYERMREEQAAGKRFKFMVEAGYDKAFSAIFDSNVTTFLSAVILFWQGTGPVRGYAVTLSAGILVSLYTSFVITRMIFDVLASRTNITQLTMMQVMKQSNFDFLKSRKVCITLSALLIAGSWVVFGVKGVKNFGVDFTGGAAITYLYKQQPQVEDVRRALEGAGIQNASIQFHKATATEQETSSEFLEVRVGFDQGKQATAILTAAFPEAGLSVHKEDSVGPQIGKELRRKAIIATLLSLLGIMIYVSIRFEFPYAVGAMVALLHDVLVAVGLFCLMGGQLSVSMVAAALTIVGYSVNDTIVIFDRMRENLKLNPGRKFYEVANDSMNQTLGRTILTSFATMLTVVALLVLGGGAIHDFTLVLFIGMVSGVYSTIYIATPVVLLWHGDKKASATKMS